MNENKPKRVKPKRVKAKITRTVTEIARVVLNQDGSIEEVIDVCEELDSDDADVICIIDVLSTY